MGMYASSDIVFGVPVYATDEDGEPTQWWDEENDDWKDFSEDVALSRGAVDPWDEVPPEVLNSTGRDTFDTWKQENPDWVKKQDAWYEAKRAAERELPFELEHFGHYDSYDGQGAILRIKSTGQFSSDTSDPEPIDLTQMTVTDDQLRHATEAARELGLDVDFEFAQWWLVTSYG